MKTESTIAKARRRIRLFSGEFCGLSRTAVAVWASRLLSRIAANRWPLAISVLISTAIYFGIHDRPTQEFVRNVRVHVRGAPEGSRIGVEPATVRVVFRGSREDMIGFDMNASPAIDVAYQKATNAVSVKLSRKRGVRLSGMRGFGSVSIVRYEPSEVTMFEDETVSIGFDIDQPRLEGVPYRGYRAEIAGFSPSKAVVTGPSSRLKAWDSLGLKLQLAPVSVEGRATDFTRETEIIPPAGEDAMDVQLPSSPVKVDVKITPPRDNRTLDDIPVRISLPQNFSFPASLSVEPASVKVTLVGVEEQLREVKAADVAVYAEITTNAISRAATNGLQVALVPRTPQDKSIFEVNLTPPSVTLTATFYPDPPQEQSPAPETQPPAPDVQSTTPNTQSTTPNTQSTTPDTNEMP